MSNREARTLICGNLAPEVNSALLYELFLEAGPLIMVRRPAYKTYAFLEFQQESAADYAKELFEDMMWFDRQITLHNSAKYHNNLANNQRPQPTRGGDQSNRPSPSVDPAQLPETPQPSQHHTPQNTVPATALLPQQQFQQQQQLPDHQQRYHGNDSRRYEDSSSDQHVSYHRGGGGDRDDQQGDRHVFRQWDTSDLLRGGRHGVNWTTRGQLKVGHDEDQPRRERLGVNWATRGQLRGGHDEDQSATSEPMLRELLGLNSEQTRGGPHEINWAVRGLPRGGHAHVQLATRGQKRGVTNFEWATRGHMRGRRYVL